MLTRGLTTLLVVCLCSAARAGDFVPCRFNEPGDAGLRVLVGAVHRNEANTLAVQKLLGWPQTPLRGAPEDVDLLAWCRCVHRKRAATLGEELAVAMAVLDPRETEKYERWLFALAPEKQREHTAFLFTSEAQCFNEALRHRPK